MATPEANRTASPSAPPDRGDPLALGLNDMLRIMDAATALRKENELVEEQLNHDEFRARLRERLLAGARMSGEELTPEQVDVAIEKYFATRNTYADPPWSFGVALAHLYVRRHPLLPAAAAVLLIGWLFLSSSSPFSSTGKARRQLDRAAAAITRQEGAVRGLDPDAAAQAELVRLDLAATDAKARGDVARLDQLRAELEALAARLAEEYTVEVVHERGQKSAIDRYYTDDQGRRTSGYYLIVQARTADGQALPRRVRNRETGESEDVTTWGEQVPEAVYARLMADKKADGVLDEYVYSVKRKGQSEEQIVMPGPDGQPLVREGQITRWRTP